MKNSFWLLIWGLCLVSSTGCQEAAQWNFAKAQLAAERGDEAEALALMRKAVEQSGGEVSLSMLFAEALANTGSAESVEICNELLTRDLAKDHKQVSDWILKTKMSCQRKIGDFAGAVATMKIIVSERVERDVLQENMLAYLRALAGQDLDIAYNGIHHLIVALEASSDWVWGERLPLNEKVVVASALLARRYLVEAQSTSPMESVADAEQRLRTIMEHLDPSISRYSETVSQLIQTRPEFFPVDHPDLDYCRQKSNLAVLLIVRALIHQDLGDSEAAGIDRYQAQQICNQSENIAGQLPSEQDCFRAVDIGSMLLDTRGFVVSQFVHKHASRLVIPESPLAPFALPGFRRVPLDEELPSSGVLHRLNYPIALQDLDAALLGRQVWHRGIEGDLINHIYLSVDSAQEAKKSASHNEAIIRYHRMLTYERAGDRDAAEKEKLKIEELGFAASDKLN